MPPSIHRRPLNRSIATCLFFLSASILVSACGGSDSGGTPGTDNPDGSLAALPSPPLTAAPSADDEPVAESANLNTLPELPLVRDQREALPEVIPVDLTDADFNAGTPDPVIEIPADVDPATNTAPYFEGLENQQLFAGEVLEIIYRPLDDDDGDAPGMFPNELPRGATFTDNLDSTRTFRWQPLQRDVGVREFAVTAVDAVNPLYRTTQTIRIKIDLPSDLSGIPNVAPTLDRLPDFEYTVRVGDPVVIEFKGIDLNGTIPTIEVPEPPAGATLTPHPRREGVFVLNYIPTATGRQDLGVVVRDSVDLNLSTPETFDITVVDQNYPALPGQRLKTLASNRSILFGFAASQDFYHRPDGAIYADLAAGEFNLVTPEGSMKMDIINPLPGRYEFADTDNLIQFAQRHNMQVHGHTLVWYRQLPAWIINVPAENLQGHMQEHIDRLMTRYKDSVSIWDVVNEPIADNGGLRDSIWFNAMGESYIDTALLQARQSAPDATLLINEFDVEVPGPKADSFFQLLDRLQSRDIPLDGIGLQLHVFSSFDQFDDVAATLQRIADLDLDIYITELDVALIDGATNQQQAEVYRQLVSVCLQQLRCKAIQTWGFTDQYSFRRLFNPLYFDRSYQIKPAYSAIQEALAN